MAMITARIVTVEKSDSKYRTPFLSANDASRWCTVRSLGDNNVYEIDRGIEEEGPIRWDSIDKVEHVGPDGVMHSYSSKPTLFPTLVAGLYKALKFTTGLQISTETFAVTRILLVLVNGFSFGVFLWFAALMINSVPVRDWTRYFLLAAAGFGTYLSTFTVTLNNHLPAAACVMVALYLMSEIWRDSGRSKGRKQPVGGLGYAFAGLSAAFAVANEQPALAFFCCVGLVCLIRSPRKTLLAFCPAAIIVAAGVFGTNWLAHGTWKPAYAHRSDGAVIATVAGNFSDPLDRGFLPNELREAIAGELAFERPVVTQGEWPSTPETEQRWVVRDQRSAAQMAVVKSEAGDYQLRAWGNWYDYPGSYWLTSNDNKKSEVDRGQESVPLYLFHVLFGHHGIFSLTPLWVLSLAGMLALMFGVKLGGVFPMRWLGGMGMLISIVVIAFYLSRPAIDRNYGGVTCVLRWLLWLAPIWLVSMLPVVDWLAGSKGGKFVCFLLLLLSIISASISADNPWVHPWLYEVWGWTGLPK